MQGITMTTDETVLFEKCPLCGQAEISMEKPRRFAFSKPKINPCPKCSAEFTAVGADKFQLVFCEPQKLVGKHSCSDRVFRGCYLDASLSKAEWEKITEGSESPDFSKFLEMSERLRHGSLPTYPSEDLPFPLEPGELVHYVSSPVYVNEQQPSKWKTSDKGDIFLTNKKIVYVYPSGTVIIPLENVEQVDEVPPGFFVKEKDSCEPRYFFPPLYDPVLAAVLGAIHNLKKKH